MIERLVAALALVLPAAAVPAQTPVYRCGNAYTTVPCSDGRVVDTSDALAGPERRREAANVAASEKRLAESMTRDRERAEASMRPALPAA